MPLPGMSGAPQQNRSMGKLTRQYSTPGSAFGGVAPAGQVAARPQPRALPQMQQASPMAASRAPLQPMMQPRSAQFGGSAPGGSMFGRGAPSGGGGMASSMHAMGGRGAPGAGPSSGMAGRIASMFGGGGGSVASTAGRMGGGLFSDERSKERIKELEGLTKRYEALLDGPASMPSREELGRGASRDRKSVV